MRQVSVVYTEFFLYVKSISKAIIYVTRTLSDQQKGIKSKKIIEVKVKTLCIELLLNSLIGIQTRLFLLIEKHLKWLSIQCGFSFYFGQSEIDGVIVVSCCVQMIFFSSNGVFYYVHTYMQYIHESVYLNLYINIYIYIKLLAVICATIHTNTQLYTYARLCVQFFSMCSSLALSLQ